MRLERRALNAVMLATRVSSVSPKNGDMQESLKNGVACTPAVSVIIPTYNRADLIGRAISSVLAQCREDDEIIIIDDGSADHTEGSIAPFRDRVIYKRVSHGGVGRARNVGLEIARCPYVAFLDSDDEWMPGKLELQRRLLAARPDIVFCCSHVAHVYPSGEVRPRILERLHKDPRILERLLGKGVPYSSLAALPDGHGDFLVHIGDLYPGMMEVPCVSSPSAMVRRTPESEQVRFPQDVSWSEDWEYFARLSALGPVAFLDCDLVQAHLRHGGSRLSDVDVLYMATTRFIVTERVWGQDEAFLTREAARYRKAVNTWRSVRARQLLKMGRVREAREELKQMTRHDWLAYVASFVPRKILTVLARRRAQLLG